MLHREGTRGGEHRSCETQDAGRADTPHIPRPRVCFERFISALVGAVQLWALGTSWAVIFVLVAVFAVVMIGTKLPISCISETRNDVAVLVELIVDGAAK